VELLRVGRELVGVLGEVPRVSALSCDEHDGPRLWPGRPHDHRRVREVAVEDRVQRLADRPQRPVAMCGLRPLSLARGAGLEPATTGSKG
jgi:hypothetical protein